MAHHIECGSAVFMRSSDVQKDEFVSAFPVISCCLFDGIAGITQVQEIDAFNHSPIHNIQTGYDPFSQHSYISPAAFSASLSVILPSYRAMPTTTPATAPLSR